MQAKFWSGSIRAGHQYNHAATCVDILKPEGAEWYVMARIVNNRFVSNVKMQAMAAQPLPRRTCVGLLPRHR